MPAYVNFTACPFKGLQAEHFSVLTSAIDRCLDNGGTSPSNSSPSAPWNGRKWRRGEECAKTGSSKTSSSAVSPIPFPGSFWPRRLQRHDLLTPLADRTGFYHGSDVEVGMESRLTLWWNRSQLQFSIQKTRHYSLDEEINTWHSICAPLETFFCWLCKFQWLLLNFWGVFWSGGSSWCFQKLSSLYS